MSDDTVAVRVVVTFLRMTERPSEPGPALPDDTLLLHVADPTVAFYHYLHMMVGHEHLWWMRRAMRFESLAALLAHPAIQIHVLYRDGEPAGFFELDRRQGTEVNLSYFGLLPHAIGQGLGPRLLHAAVAMAWMQDGMTAMTVNTCNADHPRAMPTYLQAGFKPGRSIEEQWDIPLWLELDIPENLRVDRPVA